MMARSSRRYSITSTGYIVDTQTGAIYANASDLQAGITVNTSTPASTVKATMAKTKITPQVSSGGQKFISSNVGTKISNTTGLGEVVSPRNEKIEQININKINIGEAQRELQKTDVLLGVERNKLKTTLNKGYVTDNEGERASARFSFLVNKKKDLNERLQQLQNKEIGINATPNKPTPSKNKKEKQIPFNIENFYPHIPNAFGETSDRYIIQELPAGSINPNLQSKPGGNNLQSKPDGNNLQSKPGGSNMSNEGKNMSNEGKNIIQDQMSIPDVTTQFKRASDIVNTSGFYLGTTGSQVKISRGGTEILPTSDEGKTIQAIYQEQLKTRLDNEEQRARWEKLTYGEASIREALLEPRTSNSYIRRDKGGNVVSITQGVPADRKASITKFFEERGISLDERFSTVKTGPTKYDDSLNFLTPEFFRKQEWSGFDDSTGQVVPVTYKKSSPGPVFADNNREQAVVERRTAFGQALKDFADRTDRQTDFILSPESITALKQYTQNVRSNNPTIKEFDIVIFDKKNNKQITTVAPADQLNQYLFVYAGRPQYEPLFIVPKGTSKEYIQQLNKSSITESNKLVVPFVPGTASFLMGAQLFVGGKELAMLADPSMPFNASTSVPTDMELFPWLKQELTVRDDKNKMTVIRAEPTKPVYDWVGLRVDDDSYKDIPLAGLLWIPDLIDQGRVMITGKSFTGQKEAVIHDTPFADLFASFIIPVIPELEKQAKAEGRTSFLIETPRTGLWQGNIPLNLKDISQVAIDTSANISNFFGAATQVENYWGKVGESNIQALDTYGLNPFAKEADVAARFTPGQRIGRFGYFVTAGGSELFAMWYTGGASLGASVTKKVATGVSNTAMKLSQKSLLAGALLQKSALPVGRTASFGAQFLDQANQLFLPLFFRSKPVQSILDKTGSSLTRGGTDLKIIFGEQKDRITSSLPPEIQNLMYGTNRQELQTRAGKFLYSAVDQSRRFVNRDLMKLYNTIQQGVLPAGQELGLRPTVSVVERKIDGITITEPERRVVQPENIQVGESVNTWVAKRNPYFEYYDPTQVILPRGTARTPPRTMSSIGTPITGGRKMQESLVRDEFGKPIEKVTDIDMSTGKRTPIFASGVSPITFEPWDVLPFGTRKKSGELYLYRADGTSLGKYEDFLNRKIEPEEYMPDSSLDEIISTVNDNWQLDVLKKSMIKDRPSLLNYIDRRKAELKKLKSDIKAADSVSFDSSLYGTRGEYRQSLNQRSTRMQREIEDLERFAKGLRITEEFGKLDITYVPPPPGSYKTYEGTKTLSLKLRKENAAVKSQVEKILGRPWKDGDIVTVQKKDAKKLLALEDLSVTETTLLGTPTTAKISDIMDWIKTNTAKLAELRGTTQNDILKEIAEEVTATYGGRSPFRLGLENPNAIAYDRALGPQAEIMTSRQTDTMMGLITKEDAEKELKIMTTLRKSERSADSPWSGPNFSIDPENSMSTINKGFTTNKPDIEIQKLASKYTTGKGWTDKQIIKLGNQILKLENAIKLNERKLNNSVTFKEKTETQAILDKLYNIKNNHMELLQSIQPNKSTVSLYKLSPNSYEVQIGEMPPVLGENQSVVSLVTQRLPKPFASKTKKIFYRAFGMQPTDLVGKIVTEGQKSTKAQNRYIIIKDLNQKLSQADRRELFITLGLRKVGKDSTLYKNILENHGAAEANSAYEILSEDKAAFWATMTTVGKLSVFENLHDKIEDAGQQINKLKERKEKIKISGSKVEKYKKRWEIKNIEKKITSLENSLKLLYGSKTVVEYDQVISTISKKRDDPEFRSSEMGRLLFGGIKGSDDTKEGIFDHAAKLQLEEFISSKLPGTNHGITEKQVLSNKESVLNDIAEAFERGSIPVKGGIIKADDVKKQFEPYMTDDEAFYEAVERFQGYYTTLKIKPEFGKEFGTQLLAARTALKNYYELKDPNQKVLPIDKERNMQTQLTTVHSYWTKLYNLNRENTKVFGQLGPGNTFEQKLANLVTDSNYVSQRENINAQIEEKIKKISEIEDNLKNIVTERKNLQRELLKTRGDVPNSKKMQEEIQNEITELDNDISNLSLARSKLIQKINKQIDVAPLYLENWEEASKVASEISRDFPNETLAKFENALASSWGKYGAVIDTLKEKFPNPRNPLKYSKPENPFKMVKTKSGVWKRTNEIKKEYSQKEKEFKKVEDAYEDASIKAVAYTDDEAGENIGLITKEKNYNILANKKDAKEKRRAQIELALKSDPKNPNDIVKLLTKYEEINDEIAQLDKDTKKLGFEIIEEKSKTRPLGSAPAPDGGPGKIDVNILIKDYLEWEELINAKNRAKATVEIHEEVLEGFIKRKATRKKQLNSLYDLIETKDSMSLYDDSIMLTPSQRTFNSGGQTGVDQLIVLLKDKYKLGGWVPRDSRTTKGTIPKELKDQVAWKETDSSDYTVRTHRNVDENDVTIIWGDVMKPKGGSKATYDYAKKQGKKVLLNPTTVEEVIGFIEKNNARSINIAGDRNVGSKYYQDAKKILKEYAATTPRFKTTTIENVKTKIADKTQQLQKDFDDLGDKTNKAKIQKENLESEALELKTRKVDATTFFKPEPEMTDARLLLLSMIKEKANLENQLLGIEPTGYSELMSAVNVFTRYNSKLSDGEVAKASNLTVEELRIFLGDHPQIRKADSDIIKKAITKREDLSEIDLNAIDEFIPPQTIQTAGIKNNIENIDRKLSQRYFRQLAQNYIVEELDDMLTKYKNFKSSGDVTAEQQTRQKILELDRVLNFTGNELNIDRVTFHSIQDSYNKAQTYAKSQIKRIKEGGKLKEILDDNDFLSVKGGNIGSSVFLEDYRGMSELFDLEIPSTNSIQGVVMEMREIQKKITQLQRTTAFYDEGGKIPMTEHAFNLRKAKEIADNKLKLLGAQKKYYKLIGGGATIKIIDNLISSKLTWNQFEELQDLKLKKWQEDQSGSFPPEAGRLGDEVAKAKKITDMSSDPQVAGHEQVNLIKRFAYGFTSRVPMPIESVSVGLARDFNAYFRIVSPDFVHQLDEITTLTDLVIQDRKDYLPAENIINKITKLDEKILALDKKLGSRGPQNESIMNAYVRRLVGDIEIKDAYRDVIDLKKDVEELQKKASSIKPPTEEGKQIYLVSDRLIGQFKPGDDEVIRKVLYDTGKAFNVVRLTKFEIPSLDWAKKDPALGPLDIPKRQTTLGKITDRIFGGDDPDIQNLEIAALLQKVDAFTIWAAVGIPKRGMEKMLMNTKAQIAIREASEGNSVGVKQLKEQYAALENAYNLSEKIFSDSKNKGLAEALKSKNKAETKLKKAKTEWTEKDRSTAIKALSDHDKEIIDTIRIFFPEEYKKFVPESTRLDIGLGKPKGYDEYKTANDTLKDLKEKFVKDGLDENKLNDLITKAKKGEIKDIKEELYNIEAEQRSILSNTDNPFGRTYISNDDVTKFTTNLGLVINAEKSNEIMLYKNYHVTSSTKPGVNFTKVLTDDILDHFKNFKNRGVEGGITYSIYSGLKFSLDNTELGRVKAWDKITTLINARKELKKKVDRPLKKKGTDLTIRRLEQKVSDAENKFDQKVDARYNDLINKYKPTNLTPSQIKLIESNFGTGAPNVFNELTNKVNEVKKSMRSLNLKETAFGIGDTEDDIKKWNAMLARYKTVVVEKPKPMSAPLTDSQFIKTMQYPPLGMGTPNFNPLYQGGFTGIELFMTTQTGFEEKKPFEEKIPKKESPTSLERLKTSNERLLEKAIPTRESSYMLGSIGLLPSLSNESFGSDIFTMPKLNIDVSPKLDLGVRPLVRTDIKTGLKQITTQIPDYNFIEIPRFTQTPRLTPKLTPKMDLTTPQLRLITLPDYPRPPPPRRPPMVPPVPPMLGFKIPESRTPKRRSKKRKFKKKKLGWAVPTTPFGYYNPKEYTVIRGKEPKWLRGEE